MIRRSDRLAQEQLSQVGLFPEPPIDVIDLARRLGVSDIRSAPLVEDGRLDVEANSIRILLRGDLSPTRRRFTIAHEIAHLLIGNSDMRVARRAANPRDLTERLCDEIAASILLPYPWVASRYGSRRVSLSTVREMAQVGEVSMGAAVVRLKEVLGWHHSLLRWRRDERRWRFVAGTAVPRGVFGTIRTAPQTGESLDRLAQELRGDIPTELPLFVRDKLVRLPSEVSVWGRTALALTDLMLPTLRSPSTPSH